jgi:hypothetical protein
MFLPSCSVNCGLLNGARHRKKIYIKINEAEIANDYPISAYYKLANQEMDKSTDVSRDPLSLLELLRRSLDASKQ